MSEELEGADSGLELNGAGIDPAAMALALGVADRAQANAFLRKQSNLADLQAHHLHEQLKQLRPKLWEVRLGVLLRVATACVGLVVAAGVAVTIWNAAHADGYVIESFAVPQDMAERGLTGQVVASRLLDRLQAVTTPAANDVSRARSLSTSASNEVKVEIPDTGISLSELDHFLRGWLGHEIHVSGEVARQDKDIEVAIRINGRDGATYEGPESDLNALLQRAAEHVLDSVDSIAYAEWMMTVMPERRAEARAILQQVSDDAAATPLQRAQAFNGLGIVAAISGDLREGELLDRRAQQADPDYALGFLNGVIYDWNLSHLEAALDLEPKALAVLEKNHGPFTTDAFTAGRARLQSYEAMSRGDFARAIEDWQPAVHGSYQPQPIIYSIALSRAPLHDASTAVWLAEQTQGAAVTLTRLVTQLRIEADLQHWPRVMALAGETEKFLEQPSFSQTGREIESAVSVRPWLALAQAKTGNIAEAETVIAATPGDCYDCVRVRGRIASQARHWGRADFWFAKAVRDAPSIPFAHEDWGRSLLARGKAEAAIAQFTIADQKGPHFADPLEGWGEALMAQNRSDLALAKFEHANKYAPNWGRLHLKWGEALVYAGDKEDARKEFAKAATRILTSEEKAELGAQHV